MFNNFKDTNNLYFILFLLKHQILSMFIVPEAVSKFSHFIKENSNDTNILETILTWGFPCSLNGEFEVFNVSVYGTRNGYDPHSFFIMDRCKDYIYNKCMCSKNLKELKGEYNYTFTISTKIMHVDTFGPTASQDVLYPAGSMYQFTNNSLIIIIIFFIYFVHISRF